MSATTNSSSSRQGSFRIVRRGFDRAQVDDYFAYVDAQQIAGDPVDQSELLNKMFDVTRRGYDRVFVAKALGALAEQQLDRAPESA